MSIFFMHPTEKDEHPMLAACILFRAFCIESGRKEKPTVSLYYKAKCKTAENTENTKQN